MNQLKYIIKFFIAIIVVVTTTSCEKDEPTQLDSSNRTILVYIVANNSLGVDNYDEADINEMILASQNNNFNNGRLIVYHAPLGKNPILKEICDGKTITLKEYDASLSSVERQQMQQVINDTKCLAPAKDYGLILWSHANGWLQTGINEEATPPIKHHKKSKSLLAYGDDQGKHMNITTLAQILENEKFSFIYFDCCHMATIEVMYELYNTTNYIIASATEVPGEGMPYEQNIPLLFADTADLVQVCANTFDYYNSQNGYLRSCAISLIDTRHIKELGEITAKIYRSNNILPIDYIPQKFSLDTNCYYFDFGQYVEALSRNNPLLLDTWLAAMDKSIIYKAATPFMWNLLKIDHHSGLSTYIIQEINQSETKGYNQLKWWNEVAHNLFN